MSVAQNYKHVVAGWLKGFWNLGRRVPVVTENGEKVYKSPRINIEFVVTKSIKLIPLFLV